MSEDVHRLKGRAILVIEDDYFIMDELRRSFEARGAEVVGVAPTIQAALALLDAAVHIDAAVLDINLQGEMAFPVADALTRRNIPFVFVSGYDGLAIPERYQEVPRFEKPVHPEKVHRSIGQSFD